MLSENQSMRLLSHLADNVAELERAVQGFEWSATDIERQLIEIEERAERERAISPLAVQDLVRALHASYNAAARVQEMDRELKPLLERAEQEALASELNDNRLLAPLAEGTVILDGRYRLLRLLTRRPRVHLYLAQRLADGPSGTPEQPLVAIREIVLAGLTPQVRQRIEQAAANEFASPRYFGSLFLPGVGDRLHVDHARHYLVVQPRQVRGRHRRPGFATTLAEFLADQSDELDQMETSTALHWGIQLCQAVAYLHRRGIAPGILTPEMILVPRSGRATWGPWLLPGWPPPPVFWPGETLQEARQTYDALFPVVMPGNLAETEPSYPFVAPEVLAGRSSERADVYMLGALLYLLLTRRAPTPAAQRQRPEQGGRGFKASLLRLLAAVPGNGQQFALTPPHLLNGLLSPLTEHSVLRALALDPAERFASVLDLARTLDSIKLKTENRAPTTTPMILPPSLAAISPAGFGQMRSLLENLRKDLDT
jgi:hypothetical protein